MKKAVLFVCLGNICRSPSAEAVFKSIVQKAGLDNDFFIDSAGTIAMHEGEPADSRMIRIASKRGYRIDSISRKIKPAADFDKFDYIIAMDDNNLNDLIRFTRNTSDLHKLSKITDYCSIYNYTSVPDPYYGGTDGFNLVIDLLEDGCDGLLNTIRKHGIDSK